MGKNLQYSLRSIAISVAAVCALLAFGRFCYFKYFDSIITISADDERLRSKLTFSRGRRISFSGRYQHQGNKSHYQVVWLGKFGVAIEGLNEVRSPPVQILDGMEVFVTGRLVDLPQQPHVAIIKESYDSNGKLLHRRDESISYYIRIESIRVLRGKPVQTRKDPACSPAESDGDEMDELKDGNEIITVMRKFVF